MWTNNWLVKQETESRNKLLLFKRREITKRAVLRPVFLYVLINDWSKKKKDLVIVLFSRFKTVRTKTERGSLTVMRPGSQIAGSIQH